MLGLLGIIVLALGGFAAGGGVFDWEFFFSDGYREWSWVRSLGRDGARGLLILLGGVLVTVGFIAQVVDSAGRPLAARTTQSDAGDLRNADDESPVADRFASSAADPANTGGNTSTQSPSLAGPTMGNANGPPASFLPSDGGAQPMTIWNPEVIRQGSEALVTIQYRFEPGHMPLPGGRYYWVIDMAGATNEVEFEAETLQREGQLSHIIRLPPEERGSEWSWATTLMAETNGRRAQVSNRVAIEPGVGVRSTPPSP